MRRSIQESLTAGYRGTGVAPDPEDRQATSRPSAKSADSMDIKIEQYVLASESDRAPSLGRRLLANRTFVTGAVGLLAIVIFMAIAATVGSLDPNATSPQNRLSSPSIDHLFGTDNYGRDLLARIVHGGFTSLQVGITVALFTGLLGTAIGLIASYISTLDQVLMRITDGMMAIPAVLLAMALAASLGPSVPNLITALIIVYVPVVARVVRARGLSVKSETFVSAAQSQGAGFGYILWRHIFPNTISVLSVQVAFIFAESIIVEAALSFLGTGVPAPAASWGNILYDGKAVLTQAPWMVLITSAFLVLTVLSLNLIGDGMRDAVDSRSRSTRRQKARTQGTVTRQQGAEPND